MPTFSEGLRSGLLLMSLAGALSVPGAVAQQASTPLLFPTSDVAVLYRFDRVPEGREPHAMQITYTKAGQRVRLDYYRFVEAKSPFLSIVFDRTANHVITIYPERKTYVERPVGNIDNPGALLKADMVFTRQGNDIVALAPCVVWKVVVPGKADTGDTACVTDDGIVLRLWSPRNSVATMTATAIHYGAPPDAAFDPPLGFKSQPPS